MIIKKIKLLNFRNYNKISLSLNRKINIFVGNNAQGKTNILESLYVLALTKSPRTTNDVNFIKFNESFCRIIGIVNKDDFNNELEVFIDKDKKNVFFNKNKVNKLYNYISNLNIILFTPDDLEIIKGSPSIRRNLLNTEISQLNKDYIILYNKFNKILKNRNEYLKLLYSNGYADERYFDILTSELVNIGSDIYIIRNEFIKNINKYLEEIYFSITGIHGLNVKYETQFNFDNFEKSNIKNEYNNKLKKQFYKEKMNGMTMYGPHRDDFSFYIDELSLKNFGSQGQQRLAIICFKLAEISLFDEYLGEKPVLLLDDIFSEIDKSKKNKLIKFIDSDIQTIITTTDIRGINKKLLNNASVFNVNNGNIEKR